MTCHQSDSNLRNDKAKCQITGNYNPRDVNNSPTPNSKYLPNLGLHERSSCEKLHYVMYLHRE